MLDNENDTVFLSKLNFRMSNGLAWIVEMANKNLKQSLCEKALIKIDDIIDRKLYKAALIKADLQLLEGYREMIVSKFAVMHKKRKQ